MNKKKKNPNELDIRGHARELKNRIMLSVFSFIVLFVICYCYYNYFMDFILQLGRNVGYEFVYLSPQEILIQQLKISGIFALIGTLPIIIFEIAKFIAPAFEIKHSTIKFILFEILVIIMFLIGIIFSYKILLPFVFTYLYNTGLETNIAAQISIEKYISLFTSITMCIGIIFEIPLVSIMLSKFGLINADMMKKARSFVIVFIFIIAAIITPPDIISQCIVAIPMVVLYQVSIWLCAIFKHKKNK